MRWIFRIIGALVLVVVLAIAALFLIPAERIAALAGDQFERATGRSLVISGDVSPSIWPSLGVRAEGVEIGNPVWVSDGPMLRAARLNVGIGLSALWGGAIEVQRFELIDAEIVLVQAADGAVSWDFSGTGGDAAAEDAATGGGSGLENFSLDIAEIRHAILATGQHPLAQLTMDTRAGCFALAQGLLEAQQRRGRSHILWCAGGIVDQVLDLCHVAQLR